MGDLGERDPAMFANIKPSEAGLTYKLPFADLRTMAPDNPFLDTITRGWSDLPGSQLKLGAQRRKYLTMDAQNLQTHACLLHPASLAGDTVRVVIEAKVIGINPMLDVRFGADAQLPTTPSVPNPLGGGWMLYHFTIVRPVAGEAMGSYLDMFEYSGKDVEVRLFEVHDLGQKGDVDMNGQVNMTDAAIVLGNYAQAGTLQIEDGDTNLDGVVDIQDFNTVIEAMNDN